MKLVAASSPCPFFGVAYRETIVCLISLLQLIFILTRTGNSMEQTYIKTPNPKCRLYWCLIKTGDTVSHVGIFDRLCEALPL